MTMALLVFSQSAFAQMDRVEAKIIGSSKGDFKVEIVEGTEKGKEYPVYLFDEKQIGAQQLGNGDKVLVSFMTTPQGEKQAIIVDHVRRFPFMMLLLIFLAFVLFIGRKQGVLAFIAMIFSFVIIVKLIIPQIMLGNNPVMISLIGAVFMIPVLFFISHGINWKTITAVVGTFFALTLTGFLAVYFVNFAHLTGFAAEEATFLQALGMSNVNIQGLLLAGIIIGAMGVLDDITISQASIVEKLDRANPKYSAAHLFNEAMDVGRDHIASLVNTLILVYAGAALPLLVLFSSSAFEYSEVINMELVATEIVRTLVSSIGIISAVPITTFLAVWYLKKDSLK